MLRRDLSCHMNWRVGGWTGSENLVLWRDLSCHMNWRVGGWTGTENLVLLGSGFIIGSILDSILRIILGCFLWCLFGCLLRCILGIMFSNSLFHAVSNFIENYKTFLKISLNFWLIFLNCLNTMSYNNSCFLGSLNEFFHVKVKSHELDIVIRFLSRLCI